MKPLKRIKKKECGNEDHRNCSGLRGNCSGLSGNCSGLSGNCSELEGDLNQIPKDKRPSNIEEWVEQC